MEISYRDLRYIRVDVDDLDAAAGFATNIFGLQAGDRDETYARFRSDARNYSLCYSKAGEGSAIALTVASRKDLDTVESRLKNAGFSPDRLGPDLAEIRQVKEAVSVVAPNGVIIEIVWRPMTSGWRYFGERDAGITGFQSVSLASLDVIKDEAFWVNGLGLEVSDWAGDAVFLRFDEDHHRIAIYPSKKNGLLGATWAVEGKNNIMVNWYHFQNSQAPVIAGPGRQPTSNAFFVTTKGPGDLLYTYATEIESGPQIAERGARQFPDASSSHCSWGSPTDQYEFLGKFERFERE